MCKVYNQLFDYSILFTKLFEFIGDTILSRHYFDNEKGYLKEASLEQWKTWKKFKTFLKFLRRNSKLGFLFEERFIENIP